MKVFISWSGPRSRYLAEALRAWLPRVVQSLRPWMSDEDIAAGSRWLPEIAGELGEAKVGILCVTPENQSNPWLVFEAGALSKTIEQSFVCPLLYDMAPSELGGPLAQFQATVFERTGVLRVLQNLNAALGSAKLIDSDLEEIFDVWWPKLEVKLAATPAIDVSPIARRSTDDLLAEILSLSREQLRRENIRIEHGRAQGERLDQMLPVMEQVAASARGMQDLLPLLVGVLDGPVPAELKQMMMIGDTPTKKLDEVISFMRDATVQAEMERQQLLSEVTSKPASDDAAQTY